MKNRDDGKSGDALNAESDVVTAYRSTIHHREERLASKACGCFFCLATYPPSAIEEWTDPSEKSPDGDTALCPYCRIDSVIGSASGYPITAEFLKQMNAHWFGGMGT